MKLNLNFIQRQLTSSTKQASIFVLCVVLSMVTLVALTGFSESVNRALLRDARALHAADVSVQSGYEFSEPVTAQIAAFEANGLIEQARTYEFLSVVRVPTEDNSLLADLKIVEPGYPFYGEVRLASGRDFHTRLQSGQIIVAQLLLDRLGIAVGDSLRVGETTLTIADVVVFEPDQPVNFFNFGPRIFIAIEDLEALALVGDKSRVRYTQLLKVNDPRRVVQYSRATGCAG